MGKKELPSTIKNDITGYVNCVAGSILVEEYQQLLTEAGFKSVKLISKNVDLNVWKENWNSMVGDNGCCDTKPKKTENTGCCGGGGGQTKNNNDTKPKKTKNT